MSVSNKLTGSFFRRPTLEVAYDLIGKKLVYNSKKGIMSARIVEVEAYIGDSDPACHAFNGKTKRNEVMFENGGVSYVYFIYGMYYCLNFVTEKKGFPAAVLIRAAEPIDGIELMKSLSPNEKKDYRLLSGPGKLCRSMSINNKQNGLDLTKSELYLENLKEDRSKIVRTTRIGITRGEELPYRFYDSASKSVSKK